MPPIPIPTPSNSSEASILFAVLLALIIVSVCISGYALYRVAGKTHREGEASTASATEALQRGIAGMGVTYADLVKNVDETIEAKYSGTIAHLNETVSTLKDSLKEARAEIDSLKIAHIAEIENWQKTALAIESRYRTEIAVVRARVTALEHERDEYLSGLNILVAQIRRKGEEPQWYPSDEKGKHDAAAAAGKPHPPSA